MSKHIFALYYPEQLRADSTLTSSDIPLLQRCERVLRLQVGEELILFNDTDYAHARIAAYKKKEIVFDLGTVTAIQQPTPTITYLLPLQEREQWEEALYKFAVLGVNSIIPVVTDYSRASWGAHKDYERAQRIMIAACEQAKQFYRPVVEQVRSLAQALRDIPSAQAPYKLCFDAGGSSLPALLPELVPQQQFVLVTGPEAGFSDPELQLLTEHGFRTLSLTPGILKASHAATLAVGILRSLR